MERIAQHFSCRALTIADFFTGFAATITPLYFLIQFLR